MLFLKDCNKQEAGVIGPRIAAMIRNIILNTEKDIRIAASIGMCSTEVTDEYNALYCCAESTLKYVKDRSVSPLPGIPDRWNRWQSPT